VAQPVTHREPTAALSDSIHSLMQSHFFRYPCFRRCSVIVVFVAAFFADAFFENFFPQFSAVFLAVFLTVVFGAFFEVDFFRGGITTNGGIMGLDPSPAMRA
jgi:Fe2+ transport system protein B